MAPGPGSGGQAAGTRDAGEDSADEPVDLSTEIRIARETLRRLDLRLTRVEEAFREAAAGVLRETAGDETPSESGDRPEPGGVKGGAGGGMRSRRARRGPREDETGIAARLARVLDRWEPTPSGALLVTMAAVALAVMIAGVGFVAGLSLSASLSAPSRPLWIGGLLVLILAILRALWHVRRLREEVTRGYARYRGHLPDLILVMLVLAGLALWLAGVRA